MTLLLAALLVAAVCLIFGPPTSARSRLARTLDQPQAAQAGLPGRILLPGSAWSRFLRGIGPELLPTWIGRWHPFSARRRPESLKLTVLVEQLAALLRGGRSAARLWEELYVVHCEVQGEAHAEVQGEAGRVRRGARGIEERSTYSASSSLMKPTARHFSRAGSPARSPTQSMARLSAGSLEVLRAARGAALIGASGADTIRTASVRALPGRGNKERRIWGELAACFEVAETSGCPLADVLTRFAAQLEDEDDAESARQTALAGPKATVTLLGWLPLIGLGLGTLLGIDPLGILLGSPLGAAALMAGLVLALVGRMWSSRLVRAAAGT